MTPTTPTIFIIHGAWHSPAHFQPLRSVLEAHGYPSSCPALPSVSASPPVVTLCDDAKLIRSEVENRKGRGGCDAFVRRYCWPLPKNWGPERRSDATALHVRVRGTRWCITYRT